jgi:hypothetical protein
MIRKVLTIVAAAVVALTVSASPAGASSLTTGAQVLRPRPCPNLGAFLHTHYCLGQIRHPEWLW